jgi:hypothetical protein
MMKNFATERHQTTVDRAERELWAFVIHAAFIGCRNGVASDIRFFADKSSLFYEISKHMNLDASSIAKLALDNAAAAPRRAVSHYRPWGPRKSKTNFVTKIEGTWTNDLSALSQWTQRPQEQQ